MNDRISKAWQLRHDLHAWLKKNGASTIVEVFAAFPEMNTETVRKSINRLRKDLDVCMVGSRGRVGVFSAVTNEIRPESFTREKLAEAFINKFVAAAENRQNILDWVNENGQSTTREAAAGCNITPDHAYRTMAKMADDGELQRHGSGIYGYFTPLKTVTMSADAMRDRALNRHKEAKQAEVASNEKRRAKKEPWRYVHNSGSADRAPIQNQGGQGAVRRQVGIQSSVGMV